MESLLFHLLFSSSYITCTHSKMKTGNASVCNIFSSDEQTKRVYSSCFGKNHYRNFSIFSTTFYAPWR